MRGSPRKALHRLASILTFAVLAACSGGGGGGTPGVGNGLSVSPASLSFAAVRTGSTTPPQTVTVTVTAADAARVVVGPSSGASLPSWLKVVLDGAATPPTVSVSAAPGFLATGTYQGSFRVSILRADGSVIGSVDVPVSFTLTPVAPEATPASLSFTQPIGAVAPPAQTVDLDAFVDSYAWTATVEYTDGSGWLRLNGAASASGPALPESLTVGVAGASGMAEGTYAARIRVRGVGGEVLIPVSLVVRLPRIFFTGLASAGFAAVAGGTPGSSTIGVGAEAGSLPYTIAVGYGAGASGWLSIPTAGTAADSFVLGPNTTDLPAATYTATVTLTPANGTPALTLPVSYVVRTAKLTTTPTWIFVDVTPTTVLADLTRTLSVASDSIPLSWTATASQPWITVSPTSGTTPADVTVTIDPAAIEALAAETISATIIFSYTGPRIPPGTTLPVSVAITVRIPRVEYVTPFVAYEGSPAPLIVRGGTYSLTSSYSLTFGGGTPVAATDLHTDALRVTAPGTLTAGRHVVRLAENPNALGINPSRAELLVLPVAPHTAGLISSPGDRSRLLYDAERRCLYAAETASGVLQRFCDGASGWVEDGLSMPGLRDIALVPDGSQILAVTADTLHYVDAASLTVASTRTASAIGISAANLVAVVVNSSREALLLTGSDRFYVWTLLGSTAQNSYLFVDAANLIPSMASSLDGGMVVTGDRTGSPLDLRFVGGIHGGLFTAQVTGPVSDVSLDRTGSRVVAGGLVYDDWPHLLGDVRSRTATVSPAGDRAYVVELDVFENPVLHTWDVTAAPIVEIGTGTPLTPSPGVRSFFAQARNLLTTSLDGNTLFVDGPYGILVRAVP